MLQAFRPLLEKDEEDGEDDAGESGDVVPLDGLPLEENGDDEGEDRQRNDLLDDLQLHKVERAAVLVETDAVGRDQKAVFEESDAPGKEDDPDERPVAGDLQCIEFEVPVPGKSHQDVRKNEHQYRPKSVHRGTKIIIFDFFRLFAIFV